MRGAGGGGKVPEVAGLMRVPWGSADDWQQNPVLPGRAAALGYKLIKQEG